jgi:hypothetical protein
MANTKVTGDLIANSTIATGNIADNAVTSDKISGITTAHITEGSNLYYTNARADARITAATTSDLTEGTNLYYTDARADARAALLVDSAPSTLNTLNELAAALGDDPNFATTVTNSIATKMPIAGGTFTGNVSINGEARVYTGSNLGYWGVDAGNSYVYLGTNSTGYGLSLQTGGAERLRIDSSGRVGIGTASPGRKLTVTGDASGDANNLLLANENDTDGDSASIGFSMLSNNTYVKSGIFFKRTTTQGRGDLIFANNNEVNGNNVTLSDAKITIQPGGNVGIGAASPTARLKVIGVNDTWTCQIENTQALPYGLSVNTIGTAGTTFNSAFYTHSGVGMYIVNNGRVGIGTVSPQENLEIHDAAMSTISLSYAGGANNGSSIDFNLRTPSPIASPLTSQIKAIDDGAYRQNISFSTKTSAAASSGQTNRMMIKAAGQVGIGTDSPVSTWLNSFDPATGNGTFKLTSEGWIVTPYLTGLAAYYPGQGARPILWSDVNGTNIQSWDNDAADGISLRSSNGSIRLIVKEGGYVGIGNTSGVGTRTKLGVSFNVGGSAANLAESVTYATMEMYPYRTGSTYGMFFGNKGTAAGYIQTANGAGNDKGDMHINPFGGSVGIGVGNASAGALLDVVAPNSGGTARQDMFRLLQTSQNTLSCYMYGGTTDLVQLHVSGTEQNLSLTTGGTAVATTATGIHLRSGGDVGIGTLSPTRKLDVAGEITHEGLVLKPGAFVDGLVTINKTVSSSANTWTSLDISLSNIGGSGTFAVQVYSNAHGSTNAAWYSMYWSGIMSWYHSSTNDDDIDEIPLHMAGHARNNNTLELRTKLHTADGTSYANRCELQIKTVNALSSAPISFRFRKLL